ncbi:MAG: LCP family protein [Bifidobacteriaceae bacterium]|jgi:LCP family protein required for cell wall assembly|nr:LCP family protein [Bifidobacteriaceae bacterium]
MAESDENVDGGDKITLPNYLSNGKSESGATDDTSSLDETVIENDDHSTEDVELNEELWSRLNGSVEDATSKNGKSTAKKSKNMPRHSKVLFTGSYKKVRTVFLGLLVTILTFSLVIFGFIYFDMTSRLGHIDQGMLEQAERPPLDPLAGDAINILLVGIDSRDGKNAEIDDTADGVQNTDTNIIVHISSDRKTAYLVSIPRDSMVDIPACVTSKGETYPQGIQMFNSAFGVGYNYAGDTSSGIACVVQTVEHNTGLRMNGSVIVDFAGFKDIVDAIGGVHISIENDLVAWGAGGLTLRAGCQKLDGWQALEYARARTGIGLGDGSDITRIGRQQRLLTALVKEILRKDMISNISELYTFAGSAVSSVQSSYGLTNLVGIAYSMKDVKTYNIGMLTVPWNTYPYDSNRIQWSPDASVLWEELIKDKKVTVGEIKYMAKRPKGAENAENSGNIPKNNGDTATQQPSNNPTKQNTNSTPTPTPAIDPKDDPSLDACVM